MPPSAAATALQRAIVTAITTSLPSVSIEGGDYHFHDANLNITGAKGLALLAPSPVTLWFASTNGVNITNSEDLSLGNWTIDSTDSASSTALATEASAKVLTIITLNLLNCTRVRVSDVTIRSGYNMILTAFNGGGDH